MTSSEESSWASCPCVAGWNSDYPVASAFRRKVYCVTLTVSVVRPILPRLLKAQHVTVVLPTLKTDPESGHAVHRTRAVDAILGRCRERRGCALGRRGCDGHVARGRHRRRRRIVRARWQTIAAVRVRAFVDVEAADVSIPRVVLRTPAAGPRARRVLAPRQPMAPAVADRALVDVLALRVGRPAEPGSHPPLALTPRPAPAGAGEGAAPSAKLSPVTSAIPKAA